MMVGIACLTEKGRTKGVSDTIYVSSVCGSSDGCDCYTYMNG